ncbi:MAG: YcaO-like family protein [Lachnospiraceae bacterium]|nr:YcaO-like family protein [Lachnospiraceae bacterium]
MNEWKSRGKACSPEETVKRAQGIIASLGMSTTMTEVDLDVEGCYSCRVSIDGPLANALGTNGKGMTRELCFASAYGEMMERMSNRIFSVAPRLDDPRFAEFVNDKTVLLGVDDERLPEVMKDLKARIAATIDKKPLFLSKANQVDLMLESLAPKALKGKFIAYPYYSVSDDTYVCFPDWLLNFIGSNGLAAGNTLEEALVEGLSEIVERYAQMKLFDGDIIPPEIPRSYIAGFPHILKVIEDIESRGHYEVRVLDCSLGLGIPAVCGLIIDVETGKCSAKFGAQPHMAVALERIFTESMQGSSLHSTANRSHADFAMATGKRLDKWNSMKMASANVPAQLLMKTPTYDFVPWGEEEGLTNREVMLGMVRCLEALGGKVYIRDTSYLGFASVSIYVAGMSEVAPLDYLELRHQRMRHNVAGYFTRLETLTDDEVREMALYAASKRGSINENSLNAISQLYFEKPSLFAPFDAELLQGLCLYRLGDYPGAAEIFNRLHNVSAYFADSTEQRLSGAMMTWVNGMRDGIDPQKIYDVVSSLYPREADRVKDMLGDPDKVLTKFYPVIQEKSLKGLEAAGSHYNDVFTFYQRLYEAEREHPTDPANLRGLFVK